METKLEEYNRKRNFEKTREPEGISEESKEQLKFVVQHHLARRDHFDFRLEWDGSLLSWAVPKGPSYDTHDKRLAVQVEDHPLEYRNFEGLIPKGEYGGGVVMLWDEGIWIPQTDVAEGLRVGSLKFILKGRRLKGTWALVRMRAKAGEPENNWLLLKEKDNYAQTSDGTARFTTSVRTGRTMKEIETGTDEAIKRNPFSQADVQLAQLVKSVPESKGWLYEVKYDGYRILTYLEGGNVRLMTRNGNDYTGRFQNIADSLLDWAAGRTMILDGEMAIVDVQGRTDFQALQNYMRKPKGKNLTYIVFDLLALDGEDLRGRRLIDRKEMLESLMKDAPKNLYYSQHVKEDGKTSFAAACRANLEGIIGKKVDSVYSGTRNSDWIKLKCDKRQEFVIGGYTLSDKKTSGVSSLLLGVYEGKNLIYAGRAGTGLSTQSMGDLENKFRGIKRETSPFKQTPKARPHENITWVEPQLVAEIKFAQWTEENQLRQASFKGLRTDKNPEDVRKEKAEDKAQTPAEDMEKHVESTGNELTVDGIKITHPDKIIFDDLKISKGDIIRYYEKVATYMLPYVSNRIISIVRCPKGISQTCFYKKHPGPYSKGIVTIPISANNGETEEYFYIENASGLISEAQLGTLEFHTWGSSIDNLEKPDVMVFDLDPDEGMELDAVRRGVTDLKSILSELSLNSYLKTSGGKGYHVVVPFKPAASWDVFHDFAKSVAEVMEQKWPDRYTSNIRKEKRKNKIFIDWIRNGKGATSVSPYSIRARKGAKVSMPIAWEELESVAPDGITMADALQRIGRKDPWSDFFDNHQVLK
ncbi:MAG TPA: DNA ligase D [Caproiciproducens sp.]|nr:DNA ligase D [Caproiciproducens sp.]